MVDIGCIEKMFRRFQSEFCQDIVDLNTGDDVDAGKIKTRMAGSNLFQAIHEFAKERNWDVESNDVRIIARKGDKTVDISPIEITDEDIFCITPWKQFMEKLRKLEESSEY